MTVMGGKSLETGKITMDDKTLPQNI